MIRFEEDRTGMIEHALNQEVLGIETKHLIFGAFIVTACLSAVLTGHAQWNEVMPVFGLVAGHWFGRATSSSADKPNDGGSR